MATQWTDEIIRTHVGGATFVDVGGLWGLVNEKITVAVKAGWRSATMIDISPIDHQLWTDFDQRAQSAGVTQYRKIQGNVDEPGLPAKTGIFDFVYCSGVIYHVPNPLYTLARLRALTQRFFAAGLDDRAPPRSYRGRRNIIRQWPDRVSTRTRGADKRDFGSAFPGARDRVGWDNRRSIPVDLAFGLRSMVVALDRRHPLRNVPSVEFPHHRRAGNLERPRASHSM